MTIVFTLDCKYRLVTKLLLDVARQRTSHLGRSNLTNNHLLLLHDLTRRTEQGRSYTIYLKKVILKKKLAL